MFASIKKLLRKHGGSFRLADKGIKICVQTVETTYDFNIQPSTTGKELFNLVAETLGIQETWYFGLRFIDGHNQNAWLVLDKKVLQQDVSKVAPPMFKFCVKFYPEDVGEIIQDVTLRLFYLQVKDHILSGDWTCSSEMAILLASFAAQVKFGDYDKHTHEPGTLLTDRLIPNRLFRQYHLSDKEWETRIMDLWTNHKGEGSEDSMSTYLKHAQELEMFGITYYEIRNKKSSKLSLGVHALGVNAYESDDKLVPRIGFQWSEIHTISYIDKRFVIKLVNKKKSDNFVFYASDIQINSDILALCMGNHELYMRRRKPETAEVKQLKKLVKKEHEIRQAERAARENLKTIDDSKTQEYEKELDDIHETLRLKDTEIFEANDRIRYLEEQLAETEKAKEELKAKEEELEELNRQLASEKELSEEERARLISEIEALELQISEPKEKSISTSEKIIESQKSDKPKKTVRFALDEVEERSEKSLDFENKIEHPDELSGDTPDSTMVDPCNLSIKEKMILISSGLNLVKDESAMSQNDLLHEENRRKGYTRRAVFELVKEGNTRRRVAQFESM